MSRSVFASRGFAVLVVVAIGTWFLPFWIAISVYVAFCVWASTELALWIRAGRRADETRAFIQRELDRMPHRPEPTRRQVLQYVSEYPRSWKPFVRTERANAR
jgi:hypothetical protein